jgi:bacterioferritin
MGQKAVQILNVDVKKLLKKLNAALSEEWLAYYQYWIGARLMEGPMKTEIEQELLLHANQELGHSELLVDRIIQLGGTPVLSPAEWLKHARCEYLVPNDRYIEAILDQNLLGERCAIERYKEIADFTNGKDYATYEIAALILKEELEHEEDLESWIRDIRSMKEHFSKHRNVN